MPAPPIDPRASRTATVTVDGAELAAPTEPLGAHYTIEGTAGKGGMAEVLIARDQQLGRNVALKVLSRQGDATTSRFLVEARVTAQLDHPHIVPVHELRATDEGHPAFTMKLIDGADLKEVLGQCREGQGPELPQRLELFIRICEAMAYAHERGVVHRDLKPSNIMVARHGELYVVDWGVAKVEGAEEPSGDALAEVYKDSVHLTRTGTAVGTPSYMAPEQASGETVDSRSDIYALGLILQELVALHRANPGRTALEAMSYAEQAARAPMLDPPELAAVVAKACALDPSARYDTATGLADEVRRYQRGEAVDALPDKPLRAALRWTAQHPTRTASMVGGALAIAALALIFALLNGMQLQENEAVRAKQLHDLVAAVSHHGHLIDVELLHYRSLLDSLADHTERLHADGPVSEQPFFTGPDFREGRAPADTGPAVGYPDMPISFAHPLTHSATAAPLGDRTRALLPLREEMRMSFLRAHSDEAATLSGAEQEALLREEGVPPVWVYVGLEDGVILNYPGMGALSADYDPRKRPWYTAAVGTRGASWGAPYQDASGLAILVPCNRALYGPDGFFGVAGFDVTLDTVIDMMAIELPQVASTWLVDSTGHVLVSSEHAGRNLGAGLHDNQAVATEPFPWEEARERMSRGEQYGYVPEEGGHVVFVRLEAIDWSFAVWVPNRRPA